jgi:Carboxypeptidase regulatory-like domain/Putative Flp pilus-assembly TadE/G-like
MRSRARTLLRPASGTAPLGSRRGDVKGQILILFAFILVALLVVSALAVDYGGWLLARRTYQNVADAAALAGVSQLTTPISELSCPLAGSGGSKNACAREAAWQSLKDSLGLPSSFDPGGVALGPDFTIPVVSNGYKMWVASPPSDAGAKYPGSVSNVHTIFVWVEKVQSANLSHIVIPNGENVSAWATAGRIAQNFAFVGLCYQSAPRIGSDCHTGTGEDVTIDGGSTVVVHTGDMGVNTWVKTAGTNAYLALGTDSGAYMGKFSTCWSAGTACQLIQWIDPPGVIGGPEAAIPLGPQIQDPGYPEPPINGTTMPWQCGGSGAIAMSSDPQANTAVVQDPLIKLTSAVMPEPTPNALLGAATATGTVTAVVGGAGLNGITMTLTGPSNPAPVVTAKVGGVNGTYTINNVTPAGSYTLTASDPTKVYHTTSVPVTITASGTVTTNMALNKNPVVSGTVKDATTGTGIVGATVTVTGLTGAPFTATTVAGGAYTLIVTSAGTFSATGSATNYASQTYINNTASLDGTTTLNFSLNANPGTIHGTVTGTGVVGLVGATVTVVGVGSVATSAGGAYTIGVPAGTYTVTAAMSGYTTGSQGGVTVSAGGSATVNFALVASSTITGLLTDGSTGLPLLGNGNTVTIAPSGGNPPTYDLAGHYTITGLAPGTYNVTGSRTGYTSNTTANIPVAAGATVTAPTLPLWPDHCGATSPTAGRWDCGYGTGICPAVTSPTGGDVRCSAYDSTNSIRPGTYTRITISANQCAWIDPRGDPTGMQSGQLPGIIHVTDQLNIGPNAFLFGDGVTIVLDQNATVNIGNAGGFVLNYGTKYVSSTCDFVTPTIAGDQKCFRHVPTSATSNVGSTYDGNDYTYAAWAVDIKTKNAISPWTNCSTSTPAAYNLSCVSADTLQRTLGITWYLRGSSGNAHRFYFDGLMGFLFNGILYGPQDNLKIGGQGAQASSGQIVGWTIVYAGGTEIHHRYAGVQTDGPPYLVEPFLGQ